MRNDAGEVRVHSSQNDSLVQADSFLLHNPERTRAEERSERESKDPENVASAMQIQGVSTTIRVLPSLAMRDGVFYKFWVYITANRTGTLYTGMSGFMDTRMFQHKTGAFEGFTKKYKCDRLVYYERYDDVHKAKRREKQIKGWRREKKIALIEKMNPRWQDLAENWRREMLFPGQSIKDEGPGGDKSSG